MSIFVKFTYSKCLKYCVRLCPKLQFYKHSNPQYLYHKTFLTPNLYSVNFYSSHVQLDLLRTVLLLQNKNVTNSIIDAHVSVLCTSYQNLNEEQKRNFLLEVAYKYGLHQDAVLNLAKVLVAEINNEKQIARVEEKLKDALIPQYTWLFIHIGRQENGVKFLVDMRSDVLELLDHINISALDLIKLQQLNNTLRDLFLLWFSVGFLKLERMTWKSSCEMLQKISEHEAVHPVRNWADLKKRMGLDRRCFVYTHSSMPDEPLVILHTALRKDIVNSTAGLITQDTKTDADYISNPDDIKAAIFYSISTTQKGLQGIELGNYIIKRVATEIAKEFPQIEKFSTLSPVPNFKSWFYDLLNKAKNDSEFARDIFSETEIANLNSILKTDNIYNGLMKQLSTNSWLQISELVTALEPVLMRMCARYLYSEKRRGYALDVVANFHLKNGAEMWRINWMSDLTPRGLTTSCGIMVNYRYYLQNADQNSHNYIANKHITISPIVKGILEKYDLIKQS